MSSFLPKMIDMPQDSSDEFSSNEHYLYFPSYTKEGQGKYSTLFPNSDVYEKDLRTVPPLDDVLYRYNNFSNATYIVGSLTFIEHFILSKEVYICDMHIDDQFFKYLIAILAKNKNLNLNLRKIVIFMGLDKIDNVIMAKIKNLNTIIPIKIYRINSKYKKLFHDRFICFDDELWHFGGTVGGIQNSLTAFSTGWNGREFKSLLSNCIQRNYFYEERLK